MTALDCRNRNLKPIVMGGEILPPGEVNVLGNTISAVDTPDKPRSDRVVFHAPPPTTPAKVCVSPSVAYASHPAYAPRTHIGDVGYVQTVFQARIKPDTYETGPSTLEKTPKDPDYSASEMEWFTDRRGVIQIYGILIKIEQ